MTQAYKMVALKPAAFRRLTSYLGMLQNKRASRVTYSDAITALLDDKQGNE